MNIDGIYLNEFCKTAEENGCNPRDLMEFHAATTMRKQAGGYSQLARLMTKLSPKVDPGKLNAFTRLFTKTRMHTPIKTYRPFVPGGRPLAAGSESSSIPTGARELLGISRETTRIAPGRILAALGGTAGAGVLGSNMLRDGKKENADSTTKNITDSGFSPSGDARFNELVDAIAQYIKQHKLATTAVAGTAAGALATYLMTR